MSNTYTGTNLTWVSPARGYGYFTDPDWSPTPTANGEQSPGPLDNAIIGGNDDIYLLGGVASVGGLDLSQFTGVFDVDGGALQIGVTAGSTVGGEFDAGGFFVASDTSSITVGPYVDAATGLLSVFIGGIYVWEGGGTAASVTQTVNLFSPNSLTAQGVFDAYSQFYGTIGDRERSVINLLPGGPSTPTPTSTSASIVGDAIDYQVDGQHYSLALAPGTNLSALHISDWAPGTGLTVTDTPTNDFDQDGTSDIPLVQSNGAEGLWEMSGTTIVESYGGPNSMLYTTPAGWTPVATGDFHTFIGQQQVANDYVDQPPDLQGQATFLLEDSRGDFAVLQQPQYQDIQTLSLDVIGNPGGSWTLTGVGDFNGDGQSDMLLQDASGNVGVWELNGSAIIGGGVVANPGGSWQAVGVGDFNGDGKSDILFQDGSGQVAIWDLDGTAIVGGGNIGSPGGSWGVVGVGDFNNDGHADILFENPGGEYAIWEMNGTQIIGGGDIGNPGGTWQFVAIGDYNGDGHADILFENTNDQLAIWEMNGTQVIGGGDIGSPGSQWQVLG